MALRRVLSSMVWPPVGSLYGGASQRVSRCCFTTTLNTCDDSFLDDLLHAHAEREKEESARERAQEMKVEADLQLQEEEKRRHELEQMRLEEERLLRKEMSFQQLLDTCPLQRITNFKNRRFVGRVHEMTNDHLYVDYGGKFNLVLQRPTTTPTRGSGTSRTGHGYELGSLVRVQVERYEATGQFLGDERHVTMCESDGQLMGMHGDKTEGGGKNRRDHRRTDQRAAHKSRNR